MQSFFLTPWSTHRQTKNTPRTLWCDFFGVLWHCCNPTYVPQGREEIPPIIQMPCTLIFAQAISATALTSSWVQVQWPQWCPCANSAAVSGMDWPAAALPWHYSPYASPFLSNKPMTTFPNTRAGFKSWWGWWDGAFQKPPSRSFQPLSNKAYFGVEWQLGTIASPWPLGEFTRQNQLQHEENFPDQLPSQQKKTTQGPYWNQVCWHCTQPLENIKVRWRLLIYIFIHLRSYLKS